MSPTIDKVAMRERIIEEGSMGRTSTWAGDQAAEQAALRIHKRMTEEWRTTPEELQKWSPHFRVDIISHIYADWREVVVYSSREFIDQVVTPGKCETARKETFYAGADNGQF